MRRLLAALALLLVSFGAQAQLAATAPTITPQPPVCATGLGWSGTAWTCPAPVAGGGVTVTQGPGISVTGCPACVISASFPVTTLTVGRPLVAADTMHTFVYNSATPYTMPFPPVVNGWMVCLGVRGAGSLTLQPPAGAAFYNGPVVLAKGQGLCPQGDDTGNYNLGVSPSPVVPNPNAFQ